MQAPTVCYACGRTATLGDGKRCACGEPVWLDADPGSFDRPADDRQGAWRFTDLLPVSEPPGVGGAAGGTPLVRAPTLDEYAGCRVHVKDEGENPTGSFKDRGSAVGVAYAVETGREWVGTVSHGNMARSVAAHAAASDLDCAVLVPGDIPEERLAPIARYDPTILRVAGDYGRLYYDALALGDRFGVEFVNSDTPLRVAGQKTVALEILDRFDRRGGDPPDALVLPTSSGGLASATWKAIRDLRAAGRLADPPRLHLVQAAACDPIAAAYRAGADRVEPLDSPGETVAYSIANPDPPSGNRALAAVRATGGAVVSVTDDAIRDAQRRLARDAGFAVEPASTVPLAGLRDLVDSEEVGADEAAVIVATGTGLAERPEADEDVPTVEQGDLGDRLESLVG
jgi:threonine synthase